MTLREAMARWYLRNASIRHGHLPDGELKITDDPAPAPKLWPVVTAALLSAGSTLAGGWLLGGAAAATQSEAPPAIVIGEQEPSAGSLYQFLEDRDLHLPETP